MTENQTKQGYLKNHQNTDNYLLYKYLYIYIHSWHTHCNIISETKKYFPEEKMRYLVKPTASVNLLNDFDKCWIHSLTIQENMIISIRL